MTITKKTNRLLMTIDK